MKQEEIREGIDKALIDLAIEVYQIPTGEFWASHRNLCYKARHKMIAHLHSQGVVIKVDKELPICECCEGTGLIGGSGINDCCPECNGTGGKFSVGYVAVEPIIETCPKCGKDVCKCPTINRGSFAKYVEP